MRSVLVGGAILVLTMMTGGAHASSILSLEAMTGPVGPSMIVIGDSPPTAMSSSFLTAEALNATLSSSMVAFGEPVPDVTYEKVAAVPAKPAKARREEQPPMVMRGGLIGDAFPAAMHLREQSVPAVAEKRNAGEEEKSPPPAAAMPPEPELITE